MDDQLLLEHKRAEWRQPHRKASGLFPSHKTKCFAPVSRLYWADLPRTAPLKITRGGTASSMDSAQRTPEVRRSPMAKEVWLSRFCQSRCLS